MAKSDTALLRPADLAVALCLLTRLPVPHLTPAAFDRQARAVWAFPLVGLVVGGLTAAVAALALRFGLAPALAAGLALSVQILNTGAMHEDGLADTADGFWGGFDRDRRLEIMADSAIGTYGVLALILSLGLRWTALSTVLSLSLWPVIAVAILSRAGLPLLMRALPHARPGGLSDRVGTPPKPAVLLAALLGIGAATLLMPALVLPVLAAMAVVLLAAALVARNKIGGQTGDVLGATQQLGEVMALLVCAALIT